MLLEAGWHSAFADSLVATILQLSPRSAGGSGARSFVLATSEARGRVIPVNRLGGLPVLLGTIGMALDLPSASGYEPVLPATVRKLSRVIAGEPVDSALSNLTPRTYLPS